MLVTSLCYEEIPHLKKGRADVDSQSGSIAHHGREGMVGTAEAAGHSESVVRRHRELNAGPHLPFPFPHCHSVQDSQPLEW